MTLNQMKNYYFDEATELGNASEKDIMRLCGYLEAKGLDADHAHYMWELAREEIEYMLAELAI